MRDLIDNLISATNAFDIDKACSLFAIDAIIDDVSVGGEFVGARGVRRYLDQFFVGYNTVSKVLSVEMLDDCRAVIRVDFTGDFGHEVGTLKIAINPRRLIERIDADLD